MKRCYVFVKNTVFNANSVDPDQTTAASALGLHCLPVTLLGSLDRINDLEKHNKTTYFHCSRIAFSLKLRPEFLIRVSFSLISHLENRYVGKTTNRIYSSNSRLQRSYFRNIKKMLVFLLLL